MSGPVAIFLFRALKLTIDITAMTNNLYIVHHLPKTAGSTLGNNFCRNCRNHEWLPVYPELTNCSWGRETINRAIEAEIHRYKSSRSRCVFGHWAYWGIHERIHSELHPLYITFLRDPVERCISLYGYVKSRPQNRYYKAIVENNWSLSEWLKYGNINELSNGQVRRLIYDGSNDTMDIMLEPHLTSAHLEEAKKRVRDFWFVGLTESFDQDSYYLYGKLNFRHFHMPRVVNRTHDKPIATPEVREALTQANRLDIELYEYARQIHDDWICANKLDYEYQQHKAQILKKAYPRLSLVRHVLRRSYRTLKSSPHNGA